MKYCKHFITCQLQRNKLQKLEDAQFKLMSSDVYVFRTADMENMDDTNMSDRAQSNIRFD